MNWSNYQLNLFEEVKNGNGNIVVKATAGSGKTTSLAEVSNILQDKELLALAFNKHAAVHMSAKIHANHIAKTVHSHALAALRRVNRRVKVDNYKYWNIVDDIVYSMYRELSAYTDEDIVEIKKSSRDIVDKGRVMLVDFDDSNALMGLCDHFRIDIWGPEIKIARKAIQVGLSDAVKIDFTDMLYIPVVRNMRFDQYDVVLVDEAQDQSALQLEVVLRSVREGGRLIFVGDENQAINGFAGAMTDSMDMIVNRTNAKQLPLSVCYRCPTSHINLAREFDPTIEPTSNAGTGEVVYINEMDFENKVQHGDLIVCRINAPLIGFALKLIREGLPARVKGRDTAKELKGVVTKLKKENDNFDSIYATLESWRIKSVNKLMQKQYSDAAISRVNDTASCVEAFIDSSDDWNDLYNKIEGLFADEGASIWLSSVHRAKGLEANNVFILKPEKMPLVWKGQKAWEFAQENNILFVALTRAKEKLYFVESVE
jgi:superfamily I DNA/RNA helicase